jgi:hypothetical protein
MAAAARQYACTRSWPAMLQPVFTAYREVAQVSARLHRPRGREGRGDRGGVTPIVRLAQYWNWKAVILSAGCRSLIFLFVNLPAGRTAGLRSMAVAFVFRTCASGLLGSLTELARRSLGLGPPQASC